MSRILAFVLWAMVLVSGLFLPTHAGAQVMKRAATMPVGKVAFSGSPAVFMEDGTNELALFLYGFYGLGPNTTLRASAGLFESDNYLGANFEWRLRRSSPLLTLSLGGHHWTDPAVDFTINMTAPVKKNGAIYWGLDADLIFDDDPDLPLWVFIGYSYRVLKRVDVSLEFNYGFVEVAPSILASGFVFYF